MVVMVVVRVIVGIVRVIAVPIVVSPLRHGVAGHGAGASADDGTDRPANGRSSDTPDNGSAHGSPFGSARRRGEADGRGDASERDARLHGFLLESNP
jgi:hypothetical protein